MRPVNPLAAWALGFFLLWGDAHPAEAFLVQTFQGVRRVIQQVWRPDADGIPFLIDAAGSDDLTPEDTARLLRESFAVWESVPGAKVRFIDGGLSNGRSPRQGDGVNLLIFDETGSWLQAPRGTGVIAVTRIEADPLTGAINDADIIFNGRDFRFSATPQANRIHLKDVAVHEIGHLLGLDHTPLDGPPESRPTMNPFNRGDGPGLAESLEADDRAGIAFLYPSDSQALGSISGRVTDVDETPLFGVDISAENLDTGTIIGTVSGAFSGRTAPGDYTLHGLAPGRYRLRIAPIEGSISEENFGGIFSNFAVDFPTEYFGNTSQGARAQIIDLAAGQTLQAVDFVTGFVRPGFPAVFPLFEQGNTPDNQGPYLLEARLEGAVGATLAYRLGEALFPLRVPMEAVGDGVYRATIPGQRIGTQVFYQIEARSADGRLTIFPEEGLWRQFEVIPLSGAPLAFIASKDEGTVEVIDTRSRESLASIPLGQEPIQVLLSADGSRLFVSNLDSDEIHVLDTGTFQVLQVIDVASQPLDMALTPDGRTVYVTNSGGGALTAIDVVTGRVQRLPVAVGGAGPYGVATAPQGDAVYVTDIARGEVLAIDAQGTLLARIPVPDSPRSLAMSPDGTRLYVTSFDSDLIAVIDPATFQIAQTLSLPVQGTFAAAFTPDGSKLYVTAHTTGAVLALDAADGSLLAQIAVGDDPRAIAFSPDAKQVFVTCAGSDEVFVLDVTTDAVVARYAAGSQPRGLAVIPSPLITPTAADDLDQTPQTFHLAPVFPNPFNATAHVHYTLADGADRQVELGVYNFLGQKVRTLVRARQPAGTYTAVWDGRDGQGRDMASGAYLLVLETTAGRQARKVVLLR